MSANKLEVGARFGDYEVLGILGAGGFGQVYKVRNVLSDRVEALKVLLPSHVGDSALTERFLREIRVQATLEHPNIARLLTVQTQDDLILMFLEFIDGITLDRALDGPPLSPGTVASVAAQVLDALAYAHSRGVTHRDIKPANIMIQRNGAVKLMDFGIARLGSAPYGEDKKLTSTGQVIGSLHYMSPEQINAVSDLDGRSDLYSLGIVMYYAVTGSKPFDGPSDYSIMAGHLSAVPPAPALKNPAVPVPFNNVILYAMEKDRTRRFQSAEAFRKALDSVMGNNYPVVELAKFPPPPPPAPGAAPPRISGYTGPTVPTVPVPRGPAPGAAPPPPPPPQQAQPQPYYQAPPPPPPPPQYYHAPAPPPQYAPNPNVYAPAGQPNLYANVPQTGQVPRAPLGHRNPTIAAVLGFFFPLAGALYVGKGGMAFLFFCLEVALGTVSCIASLASRSSDSINGGSTLSLVFHIYAAWQAHKWATLRNAQRDLLPTQVPPAQPYR